MQTKDLLNENKYLLIKPERNENTSQLTLKILELDHNISTFFPRLPVTDESYKSKLHQSLISDIQVRLAEISTILINSHYPSYPDAYESCNNEQKIELDKIFIATKILSQAISHKLNINLIQKVISNKNESILRELCNRCFFLEENFKNQEITQEKIEQLSNGICESKSYEGIGGYPIIIFPGNNPWQICQLQMGAVKQIETQLTAITERRKLLDCSYVPTIEQMIAISSSNNKMNYIAINMFKGIFSNAPSSNFDQFMTSVSMYIHSNPKKKAFLESIKNKQFEQALRRSCAVGDVYLVNLLIDYVEKDGTKLNLNQCSSDGKTAHHLAAIYANKTGDLSCLKKLINYSTEQAASYDFSKDSEMRTYEDYLSETNREELNNDQLPWLTNLFDRVL